MVNENDRHWHQWVSLQSACGKLEALTVVARGDGQCHLNSGFSARKIFVCEIIKMQPALRQPWFVWRGGFAAHLPCWCSTCCWQYVSLSVC
jgi:hypothetical protein